MIIKSRELDILSCHEKRKYGEAESKPLIYGTFANIDGGKM